jgi:hypothetical protein
VRTLDNRIQTNRKLRLLSSHYLVFKRNLLKRKYRIAPQQWSSFLKYFPSKNPFVPKIWEKAFETTIFEGIRFKTLEKILKCNMP